MSKPVMHWADLEIDRLDAAEGPLDASEGFVAAYRRLVIERFGRQAGAHDIEAIGCCLGGDLGSLAGKAEDGFEGRIKDNINRGGEKIGAEEIEGLIAQQPEIMDCRVVAMPDRMFGEKACAFLIVQEGRRAPTVQSAGEFLLQKGIAKFKLPERVEVIDSFPLTRVGKMDKAQLRILIAQLVAVAADDGTPG
ncbi:AMP-binding enzyme [Lichenicoccus sp.]|uniref:AMP-binding enzyme n=1 Tax=Lichenicoccus sp. TaxID=2781899 RepID=UPI003D143801